MQHGLLLHLRQGEGEIHIDINCLLKLFNNFFIMNLISWKF